MPTTHAAIPGCDSTSFKPRATPNTQTVVANASVSTAWRATTVTCSRFVNPTPVRGSTMWE